MIIRNLDLTCEKRMISTLDLGIRIDIADMTMGEKWDACTPIIHKNTQWRVRMDEDKLERYCICPGCIAKEEEAAGAMEELPPFVKDGSCPKCACKDLKTRYTGHSTQTGSVYRKPIKEYLTRMCQQCSYNWNEACLPIEAPKSDGMVAAKQAYDNSGKKPIG